MPEFLGISMRGIRTLSLWLKTFRRHDNCGCSVTYEDGEMRQDAWSKRTWQASPEELAERKELEEKLKPVRFSPEEAATKEREVLERNNEKTNYAANAAIRNTGAYLEYNNNASFKVGYEGYSEKVNNSLSDSCKEVAQLGAKDNKEHLCLVNVETGAIEYRETGIEGSVGGKEFWNHIISHPNERYSFVHNHLTDGYFSAQDMTTLLSVDNIDSFIATRLDGVIYLAQKNSKPSTFDFDELYKGKLEHLTKQVRSGKISIGERNKQREIIIVDNLLEDYTRGLIEYDT